MTGTNIKHIEGEEGVTTNNDGDPPGSDLS
jgi:hypothetical protein